MSSHNPTISTTPQLPGLRVIANNTLWQCSGDWSIQKLPSIERLVNTIKLPSTSPLTIMGSSVSQLDTSGAYLLGNLILRAEKAKIEVKLQGFKDEHLKLLDLIKSKPTPNSSFFQKEPISLFAKIGYHSMNGGYQILSFFHFIGEVTVSLWSAMIRPLRFYWKAILEILESSGYNALPIVGLLSFLIGLVIAYEMGLQLQTPALLLNQCCTESAIYFVEIGLKN